MELVYSVKIIFEDEHTAKLIAPQLRLDFTNDYIKLVSEPSSTRNIFLTDIDKIEARYLKQALENYIRLVQENNYILRPPTDIQKEEFHLNERWINVRLNVQEMHNIFEYCAIFLAPVLYTTTFTLSVKSYT